MIVAKTSIELRSKDYDHTIAKKYKALSLRKAKELTISDEVLERIFNIICRHPFYGKITPNFTEAKRNLSASILSIRFSLRVDTFFARRISHIFRGRLPSRRLTWQS